jgi:hypothetical protein
LFTICVDHHALQKIMYCRCSPNNKLAVPICQNTTNSQVVLLSVLFNFVYHLVQLWSHKAIGRILQDRVVFDNMIVKYEGDMAKYDSLRC